MWFASTMAEFDGPHIIIVCHEPTKRTSTHALTLEALIMHRIGSSGDGSSRAITLNHPPTRNQYAAFFVPQQTLLLIDFEGDPTYCIAWFFCTPAVASAAGRSCWTRRADCCIRRSSSGVAARWWCSGRTDRRRRPHWRRPTSSASTSGPRLFVWMMGKRLAKWISMGNLHFRVASSSAKNRQPYTDVWWCLIHIAIDSNDTHKTNTNTCTHTVDSQAISVYLICELNWRTCRNKFTSAWYTTQVQLSTVPICWRIHCWWIGCSRLKLNIKINHVWMIQTIYASHR